MTKTCLSLVFFVLIVSAGLHPGVASAQEMLTVTFDTTAAGGRYAPKHVVAVWIETTGGAFVKTIGRWANSRARYLLDWTASSGGSSVDMDAISGATIATHTAPLMVTWDLRNRAGMVVPDATYVIRMELADQNSTSTSQNNEGTFMFVKNGVASMQTTSGGGFNNVVIVYTGRTVMCMPMCTGRMCGDDGCMGSCGTCTGGRTCNTSGACVCPSGRTFCSGSCVDTNIDPAHCGGCGMACTGGRTCNGSGSCVCPGGEMFCASACVDTSTSTAHCGGCGMPCAGGMFCSGGTCSSTCTPDCTGRTCGTDGCTGSCGTCSGGRSCTAGACVCPGTQTFCSSACVDTDTSTAHCGACGNACAGGETCTLGTCSTVCTPNCTSRICGTDGCGGSCGTCPTGRVCNAAGRCPCPTGLTLCSGTCVDTSYDTAHCAACGSSCAPGEFCVAGACSTTCTPDCTGLDCGNDGCGGSCGTCTGGLECDPTRVCTCPAGAIDCGFCVDTSSHPLHCGGCDQPCPVGTACTGGVCMGAAVDAGIPDGSIIGTDGGGTGTDSSGCCSVAPGARGRTPGGVLVVLLLALGLAARRRRR